MTRHGMDAVAILGVGTLRILLETCLFLEDGQQCQWTDGSERREDAEQAQRTRQGGCLPTAFKGSESQRVQIHGLWLHMQLDRHASTLTI